MKKQDKEFWNNFSKVFNLDVQVNIKKLVSKDDIILSLLDDGDFIFKTKNSHTKINLKFLGKKEKRKKTIEALNLIVFEPMINYIGKDLEKYAINTQKEEVKGK